MRICILGAGALGSAIGGVLAEAGHDVTLVTRNRAHVDAITRNGLVLRSDDTDRTVAVRAAADASRLGTADLAIVLVKSDQTRAVIGAATAVVGPETVVMTLQNGLGHEDILAEVVGRGHVIAGRTYVGGQMLEPGRILAGTAGRQTVIGELDGTVSDRVRAVADAFTGAGLETAVSPDILAVIWDKLLVNVATGALSAITRLAYGDLYRVPQVEACAIAAVAEAMTVARAKGIAIATTDPGEPWRKAGTGLPADFKASMLQSLEKGRLTEVDLINGAVVRSGAEVGVATPVNATLVACVKGIERGLLRSTNPVGREAS